MPAVPFLITALCVLAIAYRYYSAFIAAKVLVLDPKLPTPATTYYDGQNFYPTNKWVLFGHHFAAISGAGPLIGPVLAAQFGFLPGFLWLVIGVVLGGAVHDFVILTASIRHGGKSLAEIARTEMSPLAGVITSAAILFIIIIALAGLGFSFVNALSESPWGVFTIAMTIPLALAMGIYTYHIKKGSTLAIKQATLVGVLCLIGLVILGRQVSETTWGQMLTLSKAQVTFCMGIYAFFASVLPVWMVLCPRDYLSSYMKLGTIALLVLAILIVHPELKAPLFTQWTHGGGPIIPGKMFPFVFITIACGAISGFHSLVASGTTPKMIKSEMDAPMIGYGAMLLEGLVGVVALIAASSLFPEDYFAINVSHEKFLTLGMNPVNLHALELSVGEHVSGRTGGAVSLAVGIAQIFSSLPMMNRWMSYWYHFAIMFEALFILTTVDTGTRIARFLLQESCGRILPQKYQHLAKPNFLPSTLVASAVVVFLWTYFILTGSISTIWPMFGIANQLLATIALCVGTTFIMNLGKSSYAWITLLPMIFVGINTITAGIESVFDNFLPKDAYLNAAITLLMVFFVFVVLGEGIKKWFKILHPSSDSRSPVL